MRRLICGMLGLAVLTGGLAGCGTSEVKVPTTPEQQKSIQEGMQKYESKMKKS